VAAEAAVVGAEAVVGKSSGHSSASSLPKEAQADIVAAADWRLVGKGIATAKSTADTLKMNTAEEGTGSRWGAGMTYSWHTLAEIDRQGCSGWTAPLLAT
jgi:hypothetical protein